MIKSFPSGTEFRPCNPQSDNSLTGISRLMGSPLDLNVSFVLWPLHARGDTSSVSLVCLGSRTVLRDWHGRGGQERNLCILGMEVGF